MRWAGRIRRGLTAGLALSLLAPFAVPVAPALADDGTAQPLQDALGEVLSGLAGVDTADAVLDPIPLTPAGLDQALSLPATLAVLERIVRDAAHDLGDLETELEDGIDLDDFDLSGVLPSDVLDSIEQLRIVARDGDPSNVDLDAGVADLTVVLERQVDAPLVALSDLVAYDADALPVTAEFTADLDLAFDPDVDDLDLEVTLGQTTLGAQVGATFGPIADGQCEDVQERDPLGMNVGILAVEATGEVCGEVSLEAGADAAISLEDWTTTPARDLFAIEQSEAAATVDLAVTSELDGLEGVTGQIALEDWSATTTGALTAWQDEVTTELDELEDFRNIELEEVVAGIAQLAVSLGATQLSGAADLRLPLLRERGSELAHLGQGILDWLLAQEGVKPDGTEVALARITEDGGIQLLEELDREALVALGLTDLETILASLEDELDIADVGTSYDPAETELAFDLAWDRGVGDIGLPGDPDALSFNLSDRLAAASGVSGLVDAGDTAISVDPHVEAQLGVVIDLAFDQARADLAAVDYDLDEFEANGGDPKDIVAIGERVKLDTATSSAALDLPVTGTLDLTGTIGFLGISAATATDALRIESSDDDPMLSITFEDGAEPGYLTLDELVDGLVEDAGSTIDVELDLVVPAFDLDLTAEVGGTELTGALGIDVTWDDLDELPTLNVDTAGIEDLLDFQFSADPTELLELLLRGVDELTQRLEEQVRAGTELGTIPLVDVEVADLVVGLREVRAQLGEVATDPAATLQGVGEQLNCLLVEELGAGDCDTVQLVTLDVLTDETDPTTVVVRADIGVCSPPDGGGPLPAGCALSRDVSLPFQLDLADLLDDSTLAGMLGSVVGMSSGGQVEIDYEVVASLHAGVELPDVVTKDGGVETIDEDDDPEQRFDKVFDLQGTSPQIVLFDSTGVRGDIDVDVETDLEVTVGPLSAAAGHPDRRSSVGKLGTGFALEHTGVDYDIGELGEPEPLEDLGTWIGGLGVGLDPAGTVQCPAGHEGEAPVTITGTVEEIDGGGAIQGATVTVDDGDGTNETATTDADGEFTIDGLPTGTYTVTADGDDHEPEELTGVELTSGQTATVAFELASTPPEPEEGEEPEEPEDGTAMLVDTETDTQAALEEPTGDEGLTDPAHACARLPLYLDDGDAWIGDIVFTAPHLLHPDGDTGEGIDAWDVEVPDDLVDRLGDALLDWSLLFDGLRYVVGQLATGLDGAATGVRVPVVGEVLDGGADLSADLDAALDDLADDIDESAVSDAGELETELQTALDTAFSSLGSDATSPVTVDVQCGSGSCDGDEGLSQVSGAEVALAYGDEVTGELPGFDLGFPGLSLTIDHPDQFDGDLDGVEAHALTTAVDWGLDLTVGLERSGFYLRTQEDGADPDDYLQPLSVGTTVDLPTAMTGDLALLRMAMDKKDPDAEDLDLRIGTEVRAGTNGKAPLHQLLSELDKDTFVVDVSADVDLAYAIETSAALPGQGDVDEVFPTLLADFLLEWKLQTDSSQGFRFDGELGAPDEFGFDNVRVDLGEFVGGFLGPVLSEVERFTAPFQPVIDTISTPIPGLSDLSEAMSLGPITMLTLFEEINDNDLTFIKRVIGVVELANEIGAVSSDDAVIVEIGSFDLDPAEALRGAKPASERGELIASVSQEVADEGAGLLTPTHLPEGSSSSVTRSREGGGFSFPAYENPSQLFGMLIGQDVALVRWDSGTLQAAFAASYNFPPIMVGPVPIAFSLSAAAQIAGRFAIGYDTYGIRRAVARFKDLDGGSTASDIEGVLGGVSMLFNGVFLDDLDGDGNDVPELILSAEFAAGAGVSLGVISAGLELGLRALIDFDLRDPTGTGRIRIQHILDNIQTPLCLFEVGGQLDVFLRAFVKISLGLVTKKANFTIFEFTLLRLDDLFAGICAPQPPNLADVVDGAGGSVLLLNMGDRGDERGVGLESGGDGLVPVADEEFVVRPLNEDKTSFSVAAFGEYEEYHDITGVSSHGRDVKVVADGGDGDDKIQLLDGVESEVDEQIDADEDIGTTEIPMDVVGVLCGGSGDDVLVGGRGDDLLVGDGSCTLGSGPTIQIDLTETPPADPDEPGPTEDGNDRLYATEGDNLLFGLGGRDQLYGGPDGDVLVGGSGDDQLQAGDPASGSSGDVLIGGGLVTPPADASTGTLPAGIADLTLPSVGSPGDDELYGGAGGDVLVGDRGGADLAGNVWAEATGSGGDDYLEGGRGDDRLFGGPGEDELYGGRGDDLLDGGAGPDVLVGGTAEDDGRPGSNVLVGGPGDDRMVAHDATVERDEEDGTVDTITPIDGDADDQAVLVGGSLTDASSPGDDDLTGSAGDDLLLGDNGVPTNADHQPSGHGAVVVYPATLSADAFDDLGGRDDDGYPTGLSPTSTAGGDDRLAGGPGDDTATGGPGHDVLVGGWPVRSTASGTAVARIPAGDDLLIGGDGSDLLVGDHADVVPRDVEDEVGADVEATVLASSDTTSNRLLGGSWGDEPIGGSAPGDDRLLAGRHGDVLVGDDGRITADGTTAAHREVVVLLDAGGEDEVVGGAGHDRLFSGPNDDLLRGNGGDDDLEGGPGDDELYGGGGDDILIGGSSRPDVASGDDLLVGGGADEGDVLAGDNARIERVAAAHGLHDSPYLVELFDVPIGGHEPDEATAGDDVLIGDALGRGSGSSDLLFGQGAADLLFGDGARRAPSSATGDATSNATWGPFSSLEDGVGGDDHLAGGPGDDGLFGGPGRDVLLGGSGVMTVYETPRDVPGNDDVHEVPAVAPDPDGGLTDLAGVDSGADLLSGGRDDDLLGGDNARVERIDSQGVDGTEYVVERFDLAVAGEDAPGDVLGGDDVLVGGIVGGSAATSDDVLYGLGGDDLLVGDHALLVASDPETDDDPDAAARYGEVGVTIWGRFVPVVDGPGGQDRLEGGAGDDTLFGGPGVDVLLGGSDRHQPFDGDWDPFPEDWSGSDAPTDEELRGQVSGDDLLVGGGDDDLLAGDNARVGETDPEPESETLELFSLELEVMVASAGGPVGLYDVADAGEALPHEDTAGDDVLIGGSIGRPGDVLAALGHDTGFGQGSDDLLIGDHATRLDGEARGYAPLLLDDEDVPIPGGDDHLEGGPGEDALFGAPADDTLIGGTSDLAVHDAESRGVVAGDDLVVGGPGRDMMLGDNGRVVVDPSGGADLPTWWSSQLAGAAIEPFDEHVVDEALPDADTFGDDLLVGGTLRGLSAGLEGLEQAGTEPGDDLMHGQGGDDALFGDDVWVDHTDWVGDSAADAWQSLRRALASVADDHTDTWPLASIDRIADGEDVEVAVGGDDLMLGGPDDDLMFGGPGQDDMLGGSWDEGRLDGRDEMDAGPGHDVATGDNAHLTRPLSTSLDGLEDGLLLCQTYRHREDSALDESEQAARLAAWQTLIGGYAAHEIFGPVTDCVAGVDDPADDGVVTRVVREVEMLDGPPEAGHVPATAGSDLIWGGDGDDTIIGQFDDTEAFVAADPDVDPFRPDLGTSDDGGSDPQRGWRATRVVEWCRADDAFAALLAAERDAFDGFDPDDPDDAAALADIQDLAETDPAAALAAYVGHYVDEGGDPHDLDAIAFAGDVLCGGSGEDTILGDEGVVTDIVEDGSRQEVIEPQQPFVSHTRFLEGTRTRQVELTDITTFDHFERNVGGDDLILGGPGGDAIHGGAGDDIINGNAGDNHVFGDDGDDVIWGGRGDDHLYSGYGDTYLDVRPRPATDGFDGDPPAWFLIGVEADTYQDIDEIYGGWGQDVLQADEASEGPNEEDRLMAWAGAHNLHYVCAATYGSWVSIRNIEPGLLEYLIDKAEGHGALDPGDSETSGFRELALVYNRDMRHNANPPHPETPGHFTCGAADPSD